MWDADFEVVTAQCTECKKIKRLSFSTGKNLRQTYCIRCGFAVIWKKIKDGEPCGHPGCCSHVSHPCERCGRTQCHT